DDGPGQPGQRPHLPGPDAGDPAGPLGRVFRITPTRIAGASTVPVSPAAPGGSGRHGPGPRAGGGGARRTTPHTRHRGKKAMTAELVRGQNHPLSRSRLEVRVSAGTPVVASAALGDASGRIHGVDWVAHPGAPTQPGLEVSRQAAADHRLAVDLDAM